MRRPGPTWTFLTNHAAVLLYVAEHPDDTVLSIGAATGLRERVTAAIIADLKEAGYLNAVRRGRRNHYTIDLDRPLRRPEHAQMSVEDLITALGTIRHSRHNSVPKDAGAAG